MPHTPTREPDFAAIDAYWRAANYLSVGQIYLMANPMLREPLRLEHVKPRLLGHWGTTPGLNFIWAHMNRAIRARDLNTIYIAGPGHGGPGIVANTWLEGSYTELYPAITQDEAGMGRLFKQFSFPGGIPSHAAPSVPGSINEGGELGYSLVHAYGAVLDSPDLLACCVIGDGEAETGTLAASWHSNKFLNPARDGAVLPVLHLNGYKIAGPTVLARIPQAELESLLRGYGYAPIFVAGHEPAAMHRAMAAALDECLDRIAAIQAAARHGGPAVRPTWPMIVLRSPKGWTGPKFLDNKPVEGTWRAHQVPIDGLAAHPERLRMVEDWLRSYRPEELFDAGGAPRPVVAGQAPAGDRRMGANPHANGGRLLRPLDLPAWANYATQRARGASGQATAVLGTWLRDLMRHNPDNFRLVAPDETASNRLQAVFEVTPRMSIAGHEPTDTDIGPDGRVMEVLSENLCQGWLEGYLLSGRHGLFTTYEAFTHIVDSMFNQHAKWLEASTRIPWRAPVAAFNYLLSSHVWRQDHNGFSHQDPGFISHVANKKAAVVRVYLPADANTLLAVMDRCLRARDRVNVVVAGKQPAPQWLDPLEAERHVDDGASTWAWAADDPDPDIVLACAGDVPTQEAMAALDLLRQHAPALRLRLVNVVDLMALQSPDEHPDALPPERFQALFGANTHVVFAFHGYPSLVHQFLHGRPHPDRFHVHGFREEGTTTTPFDMTVLNGLDRFHLALNALRRVERVKAPGAATFFEAQLEAHRTYVTTYGKDMPEVADWQWKGVG